jgi:signal transduction histidine kinase
MSRARAPHTLKTVSHRLSQHTYLMSVALAVLLLVLSNPQVTSAQTPDATEMLAVYWAFAALSVAGLLIRHRWPLPALGLTVTGAAGHAVAVSDWHAAVQIGFPALIELAVPITLYTVASRGPSRRVSAAALLVLVAGEIAFGLVTSISLGEMGNPPSASANIPGSGDRTSSTLSGIRNKVIEPRMTELLALTLAYALGEGARSRQAHLRTLQQRAADAEREQRQRVALATANERARIGRDLHDVIAHSLTVIVAQAQAAIATQHRHPQRATNAMREVISVGRESLSEMRRLVGAFGTGPERELAPPVGVAALPALVERIQAAGLPVNLTVDGSPTNLPAGVELSAYRIVQEALTNTLKHAGPGAEATVRLSLHPEHVDVEVTDDGAGPPADLSATRGNGLRGIAERVNLLGGVLSTGPGPGGGFALRAHLPVMPAGILQ